MQFNERIVMVLLMHCITGKMSERNFTEDFNNYTLSHLSTSLLFLFAVKRTEIEIIDLKSHL